MALYQDGILISGANTLPKMTLAEYNALPADQRPTYWERTDGDYDDVLAHKTDIATVESGTTASRAYSVGELVYVSGTLYRVKTAIASGATFTVGTNVEVTNVSESLADKSKIYTKYIASATTDSNGFIDLGLSNVTVLSVSTNSYTCFAYPTSSAIYTKVVSPATLNPIANTVINAIKVIYITND